MSYLLDRRPDGTLVFTGWVLIGAAADADDCLRDPTTNYGIQGATAGKDVQMTLQDWTFSPGDRIEWVKIYAYMDVLAAGDPDLAFILKEGTSGTEAGLGTFHGPVPQGYAWSPPAYDKPSAGEWTQVIFNALKLRFATNISNTNSRIFIAGVQALIHSQPVVTPTSPTTGQKTALNPNLIWTWQAGGDAQIKYRVKVFTAAVAEGGGFDPETSAVIYDSSDVVSSATQHQMPLGALSYNTNYYFYVKAAANFPRPTPSDNFSAWNGVKFKTVSKPTVTVTTPTEGGNINTTQPLIAWSYSDADGKAPSGSEVRVYKQPGGGWTGFDPNTTTEVPVYTYLSNVFTGSNNQMAGVQLENSSTYRAYVRVTSSPTPVAVQSDWDSNTFTVVIVPPATPALTASLQIAFAGEALALVGHVNELSENASSIETSAAGWAVDSNVTLARVTTQFSNGIASLQMTRGGSAAAMLAKTATPNAVAVPGQQYTARAKFKSAVTARSCRVNIRWKDLANATISTVAGTLVADSTGAWTEVTATGTAPALTVGVELSVEVTGALAAAEVHFVDDVFFGPGSAGNTSFSLGGRAGASLKYYIERSDDNGVTWVPVRGAFGVAFPQETQSILTFDLEAPLNETLDYRAYLVTTEPSVSVSTPYATVSDEMIPYERTWLKDPVDPTNNGHYRVQEKWLSRSKDRQRAFFKPLGRTKPIAFRGLADGEQFSVSFYIDTQAEFDKLERLLDSDNGLLYQTARKQWYVELTTNYVVLHALWDELHNRPITHIVQCTFMEVDRPEDV